MRAVYVTRLTEDEGGSMRRVTLEFFDHAKGYTPEDLKAIAILQVGQLWSTPGRGGAHSIRRVA
jgi:hypothetical protein